jgi:hypothetical protein
VRRIANKRIYQNKPGQPDRAIAQWKIDGLKPRRAEVNEWIRPEKMPFMDGLFLYL